MTSSNFRFKIRANRVNAIDVDQFNTVSIFSILGLSVLRENHELMTNLFGKVKREILRARLLIKR